MKLRELDVRGTSTAALMAREMLHPVSRSRLYQRLLHVQSVYAYVIGGGGDGCVYVCWEGREMLHPVSPHVHSVCVSVCVCWGGGGVMMSIGHLYHHRLNVHCGCLLCGDG
jgi:hypothetical protein